VTATIPQFGAATCYLPPSAYYFQYLPTVFPANNSITSVRYFFGNSTPNSGVGLSLTAGYNYEFEMYLPIYSSLTTGAPAIINPLIGLGAGSGTFYGSAIFLTGSSSGTTGMPTYTSFLPAGTIGPLQTNPSNATSIGTPIAPPAYFPCHVKGFLNVIQAGTFKPFFTTDVFSGIKTPKFTMDNGAYIKVWNLGSNATQSNQSSGTWS